MKHKPKQRLFSMDDWRADQRQKKQDRINELRRGRLIHDTINTWLDAADKHGHCLMEGVEQAIWELRVWCRHSTRYAVIVLGEGVAELYRVRR